jgi:protease-4
VIKSGKFKDILSNHRSLTAEENLLLQGVTDDVHMQFMEAIAEGRSLSIDTIRGFADGRIFSGRQAKQLNLVDELGDFQTAVDLAKELAGIEGEPKLFNIVPAKSWWQRLFNPVTEVINVWRLHSNFRHVPLWLMPNSF